MNSHSPARRLGPSRITAGAGLAALALIAPLTACGSSSSTTNAASSAATSATPATTDSASSMDTGSPSDMGSATPDATDSTLPNDSASVPSTSAAATVPALSGSFTGHKDASAVKKLVPVASMKFATVKFPKTLGGLPMLGDLDEGAANRYAGYSATNSSQTITATAAKNYSQDDVDSLVATFTGTTSYDGGRIICGKNPSTSGSACVTHIAGNDSITVSSPTAMSNDALVKFAVDFLNHQK